VRAQHGNLAVARRLDMSNFQNGFSAAGVVLLVVGVIRLCSSPAGDVPFVLVSAAVFLLVWEAISALRRKLRRLHASPEARYQREAEEIRRLRAASDRDSARRSGRQGNAPGSNWV
jgi:ABC-type nickel/cobalt efflux system permease component RcnA